MCVWKETAGSRQGYNYIFRTQVNYLKESSPKNENAVMIYSPLRCSKPNFFFHGYEFLKNILGMFF